MQHSGWWREKDHFERKDEYVVFLSFSALRHVLGLCFPKVIITRIIFEGVTHLVIIQLSPNES